jgi:hypothetical protein
MAETPSKEVRAEFRRSALCRVIHVDGAWGGATPNRNIYIGLYSERNREPDAITYDVAPTGQAKQRPLTPTNAILRDLEVEAIMSLEVAKSLLTWLTQKVQELESADAGDRE